LRRKGGRKGGREKGGGRKGGREGGKEGGSLLEAFDYKGGMKEGTIGSGWAVPVRLFQVFKNGRGGAWALYGLGVQPFIASYRAYSTAPAQRRS
jgi:hypothetical protein